MTEPVKRYLVPTTQKDQIIKAFKLLIEIIEKKPDDLRDVVLFLPQKGNLQGTTVAEVFGEKESSALIRGEKLQFYKTSSLRFETDRTLDRSVAPDVLISFYTTKKMLDRIDSQVRTKVIIVVPYIDSEVDDWKRTWNPLVPGCINQNPAPIISNPIVEEALKCLTERINLSTALSNSTDKDASIDLLWRLKKEGEWVTPEEMRAWAVQNNWSPSGADDLKAIAEKIEKRKSSPSAAGKSWRADFIDQLKDRVKNKSA